MNASSLSGRRKKAIAAFLLLSCVVAAAAEESSEDAASGDDFSFFGAVETDDGVAASALDINGELRYAARAYASDASDATESAPLLRLDLSYKAAATEFFASVKLDASTLAEYPEDVLEEAYARLYLGDFLLETGKMKVVWGKGDKLHVLDLFNADDYSDFIFPEYIERRIAEPMVRLSWSSPSGLKAEAVWTPSMTPNRVPASGLWRPAAAEELAAAAESYVGYLSGQTYDAAYAATASPALASAAVAKLLSRYADGTALLPDTDQLEFSQYGLRAAGTAASIDWGLSWYLGRFKTPSVTTAYSGAQVVDFDAAYDRLQSFGAEAARALGPLNLRSEAAWYLTEDTEGDDPSVKNGSLNWLFGFDIGLPFHNLSVNVQTIGSYLLGWDGVESSADVDWDPEGYRTNNKIVAQLSDNWLREKLVGELKAVWGIERDDLLLTPRLQWNAADDLFLSVEGGLFVGAEDGEFGSFADNDFVRMTASYRF